MSSQGQREAGRPGAAGARSDAEAGSKRAAAELVAVEAEVVADDESGDAVEAAVVEDGELESAPQDGPLTVGDLADGAKGLLGGIATQARRLVDRGRYRKLRVSRNGKQLLPDIPLAAVAAVEAASVYGGGLARVLAVNVGAKFLFDVEVVNDADAYFERGKAALLDGDLDRAEEALEKAANIDDTHPGVFLQLGVLHRLRGDRLRARRMLERARSLDENGDVGRRAEEILRALDA